MTSFGFLTAGRIAFGRGQAAQTASAVAAFGRKVALVRGGSVPFADVLAGQLTDDGCTVTPVFCRIEPDVPGLADALILARAAGVEVVVAVGGGAVIDLGKALAALLPTEREVMDHLEGVGRGLPLTTDPLPFVAVPTTSGTGAEVTKNAVIAVPGAGRKVSLRDDRMLPDLAIIDPALTDGTPRDVTLAAGLDAVTQVIEPFISSRATPLTDALCRAAVPVGLKALIQLAASETQDVRDEMAFVSLCGGLALANAGLGAVHGLAGVIGGRLGAPHGLICGRLLGPVLAANLAGLQADHADTDRINAVSLWMGDALGQDPSTVFHDLASILDDWEVPRLARWMTPEVDLGQIARESATASSMQANPCRLSEQALIDTLKAAL